MIGGAHLWVETGSGSALLLEDDPGRCWGWTVSAPGQESPHCCPELLLLVSREKGKFLCLLNQSQKQTLLEISSRGLRPTHCKNCARGTSWKTTQFNSYFDSLIPSCPSVFQYEISQCATVSCSTLYSVICME